MSPCFVGGLYWCYVGFKGFHNGPILQDSRMKFLFKRNRTSGLPTNPVNPNKADMEADFVCWRGVYVVDSYLEGPATKIWMH